MSGRRSRGVARLGLAAVVALVAACAGDDGAGGGSGSAAFELAVSPEFVQGVISGRRPLAIVSVRGEGDEVVVLDAVGELAGTSDAVPVSVEPEEVRPGEIAEVWVEAPAVSEEATLAVTITGRRGDAEQSAVVDTWVVPGTDDLAATAADIAAMFLDELGGEVGGLPTDPGGLVGGTTVASRLLVVSHYAWFTDEAELGLAWHIMVAPDDWAELYVRPRDEAAPTRAFRLSSWSTALAGGDVTIEEVAPPTEVTR